MLLPVRWLRIREGTLRDERLPSAAPAMQVAVQRLVFDRGSGEYRPTVKQHRQRRMHSVGNGIVRFLTDRVIVTAWRSDPWTLGAYSAPRPGQAHQREVLARPVDDRLFFAGEATTRNTFATCHGAYLTGRRAVSEIVARLRGTGASE